MNRVILGMSMQYGDELGIGLSPARTNAPSRVYLAGSRRLRRRCLVHSAEVTARRVVEAY